LLLQKEEKEVSYYIIYTIFYIVNRLALVKPEKANQLENIIIQNASAGKITTKLDEQAIIAYMEQLSELEKKAETKITIKRKICDDDDDLGIDENL